MNRLLRLIEKETKTVIGLMSGTSVDAVDVALVKISGSGTNTKLKLKGFLEYPFPPEVRERILKNSVKETSNVEQLCKLNFVIAEIYNEAIEELCKKLNCDLAEVDLIGSHGQTVQHLPQKEFWGKYSTASTLQIGDPSVLAKLTGVITVGDFRPADIALGGQGAPLVPYFDYLIFRSEDKNRALLNIGGISNITVLKKGAALDDVIAFDTGPGNMMIDLAVKKFFGRKFDPDGSIAASGKFNEDLFNALAVKDSFIEAAPPKSTGREYYGLQFLESCFEEFKDVPHEDWLNTLTYFTAYAVYRNYEKFIKPKTEIDELFVSGGGLRNKFMLVKLKELFENAEVKDVEAIGISPDAKEAICFAVLANETISGNTSNVPKATGAERPTILGKICLP